MNADDRCKLIKGRESRLDISPSSVVAGHHVTSLSNARVPPVTVHTQSGVTLLDPGIAIQTTPLPNTQAQVQTILQSQNQIQVPSQRVLDSLAHHTPSHLNAQGNVQCLPQMVLQSDGYIQQQNQPHQIHPQQQQQQIHTQGLLSEQQSHLHIQSQQSNAHLQLQNQLANHAAIMPTIADLVQVEIDNDPHHGTVKSSEDLDVRIPITRHQPIGSSVNLPDIQSPPPLDLNEIHPSISQSKLINAITSLADANQPNTPNAGAQQGNAFLSQLTSAQIIDALIAERVLLASKINQCQTTVNTSTSSVNSSSVDGVPVMRVQGNYTTTRSEDGTPILVPQDRSLLSCQASLIENQLLNPPLSSSQLHLDGLKLETSQASNVSALIASNKMLNRLLDATKPHIPSHLAKAAELAHLIPNPTVRSASNLRPGEIDDCTLDMTFSTSSRGSSPLTTLTRSSGTSMCSVTGALRSSSGYGDSVNKICPTQLDNINIPLNFQLNNGSLLLPTLNNSQNPIAQQRQFEVADQTILGNANHLEESHLDGLNTESLRLFTTLPVSQTPQGSNGLVPGINVISVSSADKTKKVQSLAVNPPSNMRSMNPAELSDMAAKNINSCPKQSLISSTDPMFPLTVTTTSSPSLNVYGLPKSGLVVQDNIHRTKSQVVDARVSQLTLADLSRGSSSDILLSGGNGNLLLNMGDTRLSHTGDVLLSELHRSDESELGLNSSLAGTGDDLHTNSGTLVTETTLGVGIVQDTAPLHGLSSSPPLQGLPSPPLPSFSLPNITSDFMVGGISSSKLSSGQGHFPALLNNLATTADLDQFLESSNMCIDMSSLSESEVSLSTVPVSFAYSPEKQSNKKSLSSPSSDINFTNALKAATLKNDSDDLKLHCDIDLQDKTLEHRVEARPNNLDVASTYCSNTEPNLVTVSQQSSVSTKRPRKQDLSSINKAPTSGVKEKRKELFKKNDLLVQQVACFKCRLCSFLSQDKGEMVIHMKQLHSQYLSDSDESEVEDTCTSTRKVKVHIPKRDSPVQENNQEIAPLAGRRVKAKREQKKTHKPSYESESLFQKMINEDDDEKNVDIKTEPVEAKEKKEVSEDVAMEDAVSNHNIEDEDTNDSCATNNSEKLVISSKQGRPMFSKSTGITKLKKSNVEVAEKAVGVRCNILGCGLRMKNESNLEYHRKCHDGSMLVCYECKETFGNWCNLAVHLWRQHMIDMELHKCDKCSYKTYSYSKLMNIHHKIHSDERPSLCDICGKRFKTAKQLRSHKAVHIRKRNPPQHQCDKCQRPFSDKRMLRNHIKSVHNKVKPFLCNFCGYSTASKSTLKMHMRQHTGEKPFACEICSYRTADHNSLRRHRMQHSGVRPYRCPYCDYASIQATTFKVHLRDKHPCLAQMDGIVFTCGICKFETIKRDNYLAHVAEHGRSESKKARQSLANAQTSNKKLSPGTIICNTPAPRVVNIDVESGAVTVESPQDSPFVNAVSVQQDDLEAEVQDQQSVVGEDQYIYAAVDSAMLSRVRSGDGLMHISPEVVAIPMSMSSDSGGASSIQGLVYVATSNNQGGE